MINSSVLLTIGAGILACLICSGFFSLTEMCYSSCNTMRLENLMAEGNKRAKAAHYIVQHFENALSTILIGNNLANIAGSSLASVFMIKWLGQAGADKYTWAATAVMTILVIIFSETIPKITAKKNANRYALRWSYTIRFLMIILSPVVWIIVSLLKLLTLPIKGNRIEATEEEQLEELQSIIETAEDEKVLDEDRSELIQSAIDFSETSASAVMTPRMDVSAIDLDDDWEKTIKIVEESTYSRLPVYRGSIDNIVGILYLNQFLKALSESKNKKADIESMLMKPIYVYKTMKLPDVLNRLRHEKQHLAIVSDEYGGVLGVISMEDVLEEIVGDIWDDTDVVEEEVIERSEGEFEIDGDMSIPDFLELVNIREDDFDFESETVGGWAIEMFGEFPKAGDCFEYDKLKVTILEMDGYRVGKVLINVQNKNNG